MLGIFCVVANVVVALWGFFIPAYYQQCMVLLVLLPCLSLVAMLVDPEFRKGFFTVIAPVFSFILRLQSDTSQLADDSRINAQMFHLSFLIAGAFVVIFLVADRLKVWKKSVGAAIFWLSCLALFAFSYGATAVVFANMYLDHSTKHVMVPIKSSERVVRQGSRRSYTFYSITVQPPGKIRDWPLPLSYSVGWEYYHLLKGDPNLCIDTGGGLFAYPWYRVRASCP